MNLTPDMSSDCEGDCEFCKDFDECDHPHMDNRDKNTGEIMNETFKCWVCNDERIEGEKQFIAHINEVHRRPNSRPDLTEEEADRIIEMFRVKPNTRRVKMFGEEFDLIIN